MSRIVALVAARNEAERIAETIEAIGTIAGIDEIVVVDGASTDVTAAEARRAGARVLVAPSNVSGKGGALEGALDRIEPAKIYLFLDADLGATAKAGEALLVAVKGDLADLAIAALPRQVGHGGFRLVKRTAGGVIRLLSGFRTREPLSGQRAIRAEVLNAVRPLAPGFGVEVAMTIDAVRAGFRVVEVELPLEHRATGRTAAGFRHRARQLADFARVYASRRMKAGRA